MDDVIEEQRVRGEAPTEASDEVPDIGGTGVSPALLERLLPHLAESIMVLDRDWTVVVNLAPPGGLIGRGLGLGVHTLEDMHPDDALQILHLGAQAYATDPGWEGRMVVRMRRGDGTYGRYEITATNRFDDPVVAGMVVRTREIPHDSEPLIPGLVPRHAVETLAEVLPTGVVLLDNAGHSVFANAAACGMLSREPEDLKRAGLAAALAPGDDEQLRAAIARRTASAGQEVLRARTAGGRAALVELTLSTPADDEVTVVVVTVEDVTERHAVERDLRRRAEHDDLTGLRNRASILDLLRARLAAGDPAVLAYVDLDGFKAVNDALGHAGGDQLLVAVGAALRGELGPEAEVARIGGDEFVVLAHRSGEGAEAALRARIEEAVARAPAARGAGVTASVGTARARPGDTPRELLRRADEVMYAVKRARR